MKKIFLIAAICFTSQICLAQFNTNLVVSPNPPGSILSWSVKDLTYIINGSAIGVTRLAVIKAKLKTTDGTIAATTSLAKAKTITVGAGNLVLYAADVIPLEAMVFNGKYKTSMDRSGKLPAGTYQLCVQLVTPVDFLPISEERCRVFTLASFQLPIPMMPPNEEVIEATKAQTAITFRWTPVTPRPAEQLKYIVTIFEVLDRQTPMQALRSNQPLVIKEIIATTQFIWQPQLSFIKTKIWTNDSLTAEKNKVEHWGDPHENLNGKIVMDSIDATTFIWTIQTLDSRGAPFGDGNINGDGISEPNVFTVIADRRKIKTGLPARIIYLDNFRKLKPGQQLIFPPINKN